MIGKFALAGTIGVGIFAFLVESSGAQAPPRRCSTEAVPDARLSRIERQLSWPLGDSMIAVNVYDKQVAARKITFVVLHHDEQTGLKLTKQKILEKGGRLIEVVSCSGGSDGLLNPERNLTFRVNDVSYTIDPNRIFTDQVTDSKKRPLPVDVVGKVKVFRKLLLKEIFPNLGKAKPLRRGEKVLIAVHNNTNPEPGKEDTTNIDSARDWAEVNSEKVHKVDGVDIDDFFLVTDIPKSRPKLYDYFKNIRHNQKGFNLAAQHSSKAKIRLGDDGSLSVYCGLKGIPYINVEAEDGNTGQQSVMLDAVFDLLRIK